MDYIKVLTESFKVIKTVIQGADKTFTEIDETVTEGKKVVSKGTNVIERIVGNKKVQNEEPYPIIPRPASDSKAEIYDWMYKESENIHLLLCDKLWELTGLFAEYPNIWFSVEKNKDKLFFTVYHLSEWKQFKDRLLLETFSLEPRLEKLNKYEFDEEDLKRINKSIELINGFNKPKSNLEMAHYFDKTDKLLAAYYYRKFLNIFLFEFLRTKTIEEMTPEEREARMEKLEKSANEMFKKVSESVKK